MVWSSVSPDGTKSVKTNTPVMAANTVYTEGTMNVDHFWNIGTNQDGHHKYAQMPAYTVGGMPADPALATGMDGEIYFRTVSASNARIELFSRNISGVYQIGPSYQTGTAALTGTYSTIATVPDNCYGQIYILSLTANDYDSWGFFTSSNGIAQSYVNTSAYAGSSTPGFNHKYGNGSEASGLDIRVRTNGVPSANYGFRIVYWGN